MTTTTGPVQRINTVTQLDIDGRLIHDFRQSLLSELDECAERGRLVIAEQMPRVETDAACIGTACHAAFEGMIEHGLGLDEAIEDGLRRFDLLASAEGFEWKKYKPAAVPAIIERIVTTFAEEVLWTLEPVAVEIPFDGLVLHEDDQRIIRLNGTIDYLDRYLGAVDWKTAGDLRRYTPGFGGEAWKLDRWNIQSSVYTWALVQEGFLDPDGPWPFTFYAFEVPSGQLVTHTVIRRPADHEWLREKCVAWAVLIEADLPVWPLTDNHALCSPKWCPAFDACKGKHFVGAEWPMRWRDR